MQSRWRGRFLALIAGVLYPLAFEPWGWWPLVLLSPALGWWSLRRVTTREAVLRGWMYGLGFFGLGVAWVHVSIHVYGATPLWLAVPMTAVFAAVLALYYALLFGLTRRLGSSALVFAGLWVLVDWLRGWLLTGFPWLYPGYALVDTPLAGLAPLGGIWSISLAALLTAVGLAQLILDRHRAWTALVPALLAWTAGAALGPGLWVEPAGQAQPVALVQGDIPQNRKWQQTQRATTRRIYRNLSRKTPDGALVIWPESAITEFYQDVRGYLDQVGETQLDNNGALITGIPWRRYSEGEWRYHNSITVVAGGDGTYHKQKLVPFGEYVPLEGLLRGLMPFFNLPMSSFTPGDPGQGNLQALGHELSPFICYEILYPGLVAERSQGSDVLLTISNDAWFGTSAGPHQHFQMARLRARETGRWLLRGTNNGITAVVGPDGTTRARASQFERTVLLSSFRPVEGTTPFMRLGDWPALVLACLFVLAGAWSPLRGRA
jgi:apolipoprotein N-acyltransferase